VAYELYRSSRVEVGIVNAGSAIRFKFLGCGWISPE